MTPPAELGSQRPAGTTAWVCGPPFARERTISTIVEELRYGAGMKGKVGHSMGFGLPVVTTGIGAEGLDGQGSVLQ